MEILFEKVRLGPITLKNRLLLTALSTSFAGPRGQVTPRLTAYYAARAAGGVGLVTVEEAAIHPHLPHIKNALGVHSDDCLPGLAGLTEAIHRAGAAASLQIGLYFRTPITGLARFTASAQAPDAGPGCLELNPAELIRIVHLFAAAAGRARRAGFEAVEVHACHGCILSEFLSPYWNKRTDSYGGDIQGRARLALEVLAAIRAEVGPDYPVIFRISGSEFHEGGFSPADGLALARLLAQGGVTALSVSGGLGHVNHLAIPPSHVPRGPFLDLAGRIKAAVAVPVIVANSLTPELAVRAVAQGQADLIGLGRPLLADPDWPRKAAAGRLPEIRPCIRCNQGCVGGLRSPAGRGVTCLGNPEVGREGEGLLRPTDHPRRVAVIGGGPAGCEAARVLSLRGHRVVLLEKSDRLGGQFNLAAVPRHKAEFRGLVDFYAQELDRLGVEVRLKTPASPEVLGSLAAEVHIVAGGAEPVRPPLPGIDLGHVVTAADVLAGVRSVATGPVVVLGGGATGLETAELLAERGLAVTVVEMMTEVGRDIQPGLGVRESLLERLAALKVALLPGHRAMAVTAAGVEVSDRPFIGGGRTRLLPAQAVVLALGLRPRPGLEDLARRLGGEWFSVGDCLEPGNALAAIHAAFDLATRI